MKCLRGPELPRRKNFTAKPNRMDQKRRQQIKKKLAAIVGEKWVLHSPVDLWVYGYDASLATCLPDFVVLPANVHQIAAVVRLALKEKIPYLPRGAGTNLTGGSIPTQGGIVIETSRLKSITEIDLPNLRAEVEVGATNLEVQNALNPLGYLYAPDPASQKVSTMGGNIGENSGGPHCLKYGVTTNHVLGLEMVMPDGQIITLGGKCLDPLGYDLVGLMVGSEGTLGIASRVTIRLLHQSQSVQTILAIFDSLDDASRTVSAIIAAGIIPAALEMIDQVVLQAVEASVKAGYPLDAQGVLIIEIDGIQQGLLKQAERIQQICQANGVREIRIAKDAAEREILWKGRRGAFGAVARVKTSYLCADGTVPRTQLPKVLRQVKEIGQKYDLTIGNVFHAGDGNLHPLILFDDREPGVREKVIQAGAEILKVCAEVGGTISGEHGIGLEKIDSMPLIFSADDIACMRQIKEAFDPQNLCNPGKIFPPPELSSSDQQNYPSSFADGDFPSSLKKIVSPENCWPKEKNNEFAVDGQVPSWVVFPADLDQVQTILALAAEKKAPLIPRGGGTKIGLGQSPQPFQAVLNLARLNQIIDLDLENLTITIAAGAKLARLQESLAQHGYFIPLDPPFPQATIGGILATNDSGPKRLLYGSARDITLGMKVVLPGGKIIKAGGKTVKNVSGYDLTKLFIGSLGTLGVIGEATLRLFPLPEKETILLLNYAELSPAFALAMEILHSELLPSAIILLNKEAQTASSLPHFVDNFSNYGLLIGLAGTKEEVKGQLPLILKWAEKGTSKWQIWEKEWPAHIWKAFQELPDRLSSKEGFSISGKASLLISKGAEIFKEAEDLFQKNSLQPVLIGNLGTGTLNFFLSSPPETISHLPNKILENITTLRKKLEGEGGNLVITACPPQLKKELSVWGNVGPSFPYMQAIKNALDPGRILNPGRFYGGI
ncbi:MAG: FAD-binding oxidoreductase [Thermodesulfobacteriota bacterium]